MESSEKEALEHAGIEESDVQEIPEPEIQNHEVGIRVKQSTHTRFELIDNSSTHRRRIFHEHPRPPGERQLLPNPPLKYGSRRPHCKSEEFEFFC